MSEEVFTAEQVADYLQMSRSMVYKMVQTKEIPYAKLRTSLRFPKAMIDRWLRQRTVWPHQSLLEEFELLYERFHLKKFLRAKGIDYEGLSEDELVEQLRQAVEELKLGEKGRLEEE